MPTGYTADVVNGKVTDFPTFALQCARAFGACIMQRDDPINEPLKLREVDEYCRQAVTTARAELATFSAAGPEELAALWENEYVRCRASWETRNLEAATVAERIDAMTRAVEQWTPPTSEHRGLKDFMLEQLAETRRFDGTVWGEEPQRRNPAEWAIERAAVLRRNVERAEESLRDEVTRCAEQNTWIELLYRSLTHA